jgi:hypothetical protein
MSHASNVAFATAARLAVSRRCSSHGTDCGWVRATHRKPGTRRGGTDGTAAGHGYDWQRKLG